MFSSRILIHRVRMLICLFLMGCAINCKDAQEEFKQTEVQPTPTSCTGWMCEISGVVYMGTALPGNEAEGVIVNLSQHSWCSPTAGEQEARSGPQGEFVFDVYLHDTDSFVFQVDEVGFETVKVKLGGFDCLYCNCQPVEIVLEEID